MRRYIARKYKKEKICKQCGLSFIPYNKGQKFCCLKCRKKRDIKNGCYPSLKFKKKKCKYCRKIFKPKYGFHSYCSIRCQQLSRNNLKLQKPIVREYYLEKANFTCEKCGISEVDLHLHHIVPLFRGGKDIENNIQVLCKKCHFEKHKFLGH